MRVSVDALLAELGALVGGHVRAATDADAVAGVQPELVVEPGGEEEVAAALAFANERGLAVIPRGGGTQLALGFPPERAEIVLSLARLNRVLEYVPHDQTVSVQAGTRLADLQAALAEASQWLALDPLLADGATVGGVVATNATGARRLRYGGVRDQIIGVRIATADGVLARGGGKVVKNVAGYDLPKLLTGSLGTLGVIVSATFRVYPLPTASRTVTLRAADPTPLGELALRIVASTLVPTIVDILGPAAPGGGFALAVRFESGVEDSAVEQSAELQRMAGEYEEEAAILAGEAETDFWRQVDAGLTPPPTPSPAGGGDAGGMLLKTNLVLTEIAPWLAGLRAESNRRGLAVRSRAHAGHGIIYTRLSGEESELLAAVETLRAAAIAGRGSLVVQEAPPELLRQMGVWGLSPALDVMRRVKERFDPNGILNPGRFVGHI
jgi:glycolate oxidase FAD binding subunit